MTSSISSSDAASRWGRWLASFLGTLLAGALLILLLMIAVDPYDSGQFGWLDIQGVTDGVPHTANASRARDPRFDSAVIGNSTAQRLDPTELSRATGTRMVMLTAAGTYPREHLTVLDFFLRHHRNIGALVIVADAPWCSHDDPSRHRSSFPFWIYGDHPLAYLGHLFSWRSLDHTFQRIMIGLGLKLPDNPDGTVNYEEVWPPGQFREVNPPQDPAPAFTAAQRETFPAIAELDIRIKRLAAGVPVVLVVPPTYYTQVPAPGSVASAERDACRGALHRIVADRLRGNLLDYRIDGPLTRDPDNFADFVHYRLKIASKIEQGIATSIRLGNTAKIDF